MNRVTTLNFGTIGRCACGAIGKRRDRYAGEPVCPKCYPVRVGILLVVDPVRDLVHGSLTPAQRRARREFLRSPNHHPTVQAFDESLLGVPNDTRQPAARQTLRERGER